MTGWTLINFEDVDSGAPPDAPVDARMVREHLGSTELGVSRFRYEPNARVPFGHKHREQEEVYVVAGGSGQVKFGNEVIDIRIGDVLRVAPEVIRGFAAGADGLELICVGGRRPEGGDGEMVQDFWP